MSEEVTHSQQEQTPNLGFVLRQSFQGGVLMLFGLVVFATAISGLYLNYLQSWYGPMLYASAGVLWFLGVWSLISDSELMEGEHADKAKAQHVHSHTLPKVGALLLAPAFLIAAAAPGPLGLDAVERVGVQAAQNEEVDFSELPGGQITELSMRDYSDRFEWGDPKQLIGKKVKLLGFVGDGEDSASFSVNRFGIFCCAADARAYTVQIAGMERPQGEDTWVEVVGEIDIEASEFYPVLVVDSVTEVDPPEEPYV